MHYLEEVRELLKGFDDSIDKIEKDVAIILATMAHKDELENVKGQITEMTRHNGRVIKLLASIITALLSVIVYLVAR